MVVLCLKKSRGMIITIMTKRVSFFLTKMLYFTLAILFLIAFGLSIYAFFNPDMHFFQLDMQYRAVAFLLLVLFLLGLLFIIKRAERNPDTDRINYVDLIMLFFIAFCARLVFLLFYGYFVAPVSDFQMAHITAQGWAPPEFFELYRMYTNWAVYTVILGILYDLTISHFIMAQFLNVIFSSLTAVVIYAISLKISHKRSIAYTAAVFFALYPANILSNALLFMDHIAVFLICTIIYFMLRMRQADNLNQSSPVKYYIICVITGIILGVENSLKTMSTVLIIAFLISLTIDFFINKDDVKAASLISKPIFKIISTAVILVSFMTVSNYAVERVAQEVHGIEFTDSRNITASMIYIGLQPSGEGQIHLGDNPRLFQTMLEKADGDFDLARQMTYDFLWQDIRENPGQFALLFPQKFRWAWQDDTVPSYFVWITPAGDWVSIFQNPDPISPRLEYIARVILPSISQIFYIALVGFSVIGFLGAVKQRFCFGKFLMSLYSFGFILLLLIIEAQSRYKIMIIPCLCILAAYGIYITFNRVSRIRIPWKKYLMKSAEGK